MWHSYTRHRGSKGGVEGGGRGMWRGQWDGGGEGASGTEGVGECEGARDRGRGAGENVKGDGCMWYGEECVLL